MNRAGGPGQPAPGTLAPKPALAGCQPRHPSNHLRAGGTSLFLVESERLFKDSAPTAACWAGWEPRVTPSSSPGPTVEVTHSPRTQRLCAGRPASTVPTHGWEQTPSPCPSLPARACRRCSGRFVASSPMPFGGSVVGPGGVPCPTGWEGLPAQMPVETQSQARPGPGTGGHYRPTLAQRTGSPHAFWR